MSECTCRSWNSSMSSECDCMSMRLLMHNTGTASQASLSSVAVIRQVTHNLYACCTLDQYMLVSCNSRLTGCFLAACLTINQARPKLHLLDYLISGNSKDEHCKWTYHASTPELYTACPAEHMVCLTGPDPHGSVWPCVTTWCSSGQA